MISCIHGHNWQALYASKKLVAQSGTLWAGLGRSWIRLELEVTNATASTQLVGCVGLASFWRSHREVTYDSVSHSGQTNSIEPCSPAFGVRWTIFRCVESIRNPVGSYWPSVFAAAVEKTSHAVQLVLDMSAAAMPCSCARTCVPSDAVQWRHVVQHEGYRRHNVRINFSEDG